MQYLNVADYTCAKCFASIATREEANSQGTMTDSSKTQSLFGGDIYWSGAGETCPGSSCKFYPSLWYWRGAMTPTDWSFYRVERQIDGDTAGSSAPFYMMDELHFSHSGKWVHGGTTSDSKHMDNSETHMAYGLSMPRDSSYN